MWRVGREYGSVPSISKNDDRVLQKPRIKDQCLKQRALELWCLTGNGDAWKVKIGRTVEE